MLQIIFKAIEKCNSNCAYCDVVHKTESISSIMQEELLETVFIRMDEYLKNKPEEYILFTWHGGEPLLLGPEYFMKAWKLQEKHCQDTKSRIHHGVQTNLTLFREEFIPPFQRLGIRSFGTSYDPVPQMRGPGDPCDSETYNRMFIQAAGLCERNNFEWGIIYVVTKRSLENPLDLFFFLTNFRTNGGVNLNPVLIYGEDKFDLVITPQEYCDFLGVIFPYWWKHKERYPIFEPFRSLVSTIRDKSPRLMCGEGGKCAYTHVNIDPEGKASQCGRSADWGDLDYGNIRDRTLIDILQDPLRRNLIERIDVLEKTECKGCRFWNICHGGCPLDALATQKSIMHKSEWSEARREFIEKYFEPVTGLRYEQ